jgi:hypothetical protein
MREPVWRILSDLSVPSLCLFGGLAGCRPHSELVPTPAPPVGYEYAVAIPDCAPWDALAVTLYLAPVRVDHEYVDPPFLRVSVYSSRTPFWDANSDGRTPLRRWARRAGVSPDQIACRLGRGRFASAASGPIASWKASSI